MSSPNITKSLIGLQNWLANQVKESPVLEKQLRDLSNKRKNHISARTRRS